MYIAPASAEHRGVITEGSYAAGAKANLPTRGLQYLSSPALPAPLRKSVDMSDVSPSTTFNGTYGLTATLTASYGRLRPLDSAGSGQSQRGVGYGNAEGSSNFFAETLRSIGPSARKLLLREAAQHEGAVRFENTDGGAVEWNSTSAGNRSLPDPKMVSFKSSTHSGGKKSGRAATQLNCSRESDEAHTAPFDTISRATLDGAVSLKRPHGPTSGQRAATTLRGATPIPSLRNSRSLGFPVNGISGTVVTRNPAVEPPLVESLRRYLEREIHLAKEGTPVPSSLDQLGAYREAFGALISAFPGYSSILSDIKSAYEGVVQLQAELLTDAYVEEQQRMMTASERKSELSSLHGKVDDLERQLQASRTELLERDAKREAELSAKERQTSAGARANNYELRRQLEHAEARATQLEKSSRHDVEKILVLIGAVRECDKRIKELEKSVDHMSGQVAELDEFKRVAGEAQGELTRYKEKYCTFVPAADFESMKEHLVSELTAAQALVKRLRRTAAVRGTQLDVMQRRVRTLEHEVEVFRDERGNERSATGEEDGLDSLLTPRPDWKAFERVLPELADYAKPVHSYSLSANTLPTATASTGHGGAGGQRLFDGPLVDLSGESPTTRLDEADDGGSDAEMLVVQGPDRTSMRIAFLVEFARSLQERVAMLEVEGDAAMKAARQTHAERLETGTRTVAGDDSTTTAPQSSADRGGGFSSYRSHGHFGARTSITADGGANGGLGGGSGRQRNVAASNASDGDMLASVHSGVFHTATGVLAPGTSRGKVPMPLIGPGMSDTVPPHLRCVGTVRRVVLDFDAGVVMAYEFFIQALKPMITEDETSALAFIPASASSRFHDFVATVLEHGGIPLPPVASPSNESSRPPTSTSRTTTVVTVKSKPAAAAALVAAPTSLLAPRGVAIALHLPYACAAHLAMNLEADARDPQLTNPAILLCSYVLSGAMPVRLAVEAASVVERIVSDLVNLAAEAQKPRLLRSTVNECLQPILELRSAAELAELRSALAADATFDVISLTSMKNRFLRTLFFQECTDNMAFYTKLVQAVTEKAQAAPHLPAVDRENCGDGDYLISLENVAAAIISVEPLTPAIVVRELTENAVVPNDGDSGKDGGAGRGREIGDTAPADNAHRVVKLSEIIRALGEAPVIRRTRISNSMECVL